MRLMIGRFIANRINDAGGLQIVQVDGLEGETRDGVERIQNFGHSGNPPAGAVAAGVSVMGSRDHLVLVACDHPEHRVKGLAPGESALYGAFGNSLTMNKDGFAVFKAKGLILDVETFQNNAKQTNAPGKTAVGSISTDKSGDLDQHYHDEDDGGQTSGARSGGGA